MKGEQKQMAVTEVEAGAEVAADVFDNAGHLLVPAGTELTEKMLQILDRRGISTIEVREQVVLDDEEKQEMLAEVQSRLDSQFAATEQSSCVGQLKEMLFRYHTREI